jgi:hypothetical protein
VPLGILRSLQVTVSRGSSQEEDFPFFGERDIYANQTHRILITLIFIKHLLYLAL